KVVRDVADCLGSPVFHPHIPDFWRQKECRKRHGGKSDGSQERRESLHAIYLSRSRRCRNHERILSIRLLSPAPFQGFTPRGLSPTFAALSASTTHDRS